MFLTGEKNLCFLLCCRMGHFEEVIGEGVVHPCHFESQKEYVKEVLEREVDKRLEDKGYVYKDDLPNDWASYKVQELTGRDGIPSEQTIRIIREERGEELHS